MSVSQRQYAFQRESAAPGGSPRLAYVSRAQYSPEWNSSLHTHLRATLRARDAQIERLQLEREHLRVSAAVAATPEDVRRARTLVSELVRDIDLCIADLTRDI